MNAPNEILTPLASIRNRTTLVFLKDPIRDEAWFESVRAEVSTMNLQERASLMKTLEELSNIVAVAGATRGSA